MVKREIPRFSKCTASHDFNDENNILVGQRKKKVSSKYFEISAPTEFIWLKANNMKVKQKIINFQKKINALVEETMSDLKKANKIEIQKRI